jgi:hypothetical protein
MTLPAPSTIRAAVPKAKLTGPCSPLTTTVLPGSYVVTVPAVYVVLVVCVVVTGSVVVWVVVVLVCANAKGAANAQARAIIVLFIYIPPLIVLMVIPSVMLGLDRRP